MRLNQKSAGDIFREYLMKNFAAAGESFRSEKFIWLSPSAAAFEKNGKSSSYLDPFILEVIIYVASEAPLRWISWWKI